MSMAYQRHFLQMEVLSSLPVASSSYYWIMGFSIESLQHTTVELRFDEANEETDPRKCFILRKSGQCQDHKSSLTASEHFRQRYSDVSGSTLTWKEPQGFPLDSTWDTEARFDLGEVSGS